MVAEWGSVGALVKRRYMRVQIGAEICQDWAFVEVLTLLSVPRYAVDL